MTVSQKVFVERLNVDVTVHKNLGLARLEQRTHFKGVEHEIGSDGQNDGSL